jgi:hypothetical protein
MFNYESVFFNTIAGGNSLIDLMIQKCLNFVSSCFILVRIGYPMHLFLH